MPARRKKTDLCAEHFPGGLAGQPADATQVSCAHGSWDVEPQTGKQDEQSGDGEQDGGE